MIVHGVGVQGVISHFIVETIYQWPKFHNYVLLPLRNTLAGDDVFAREDWSLYLLGEEGPIRWQLFMLTFAQMTMWRSKSDTRRLRTCVS